AGKYGTNVLSCPVSGTFQLLTSSGPLGAPFTAGVNWTTNTIAFNSGPNSTPITITSLDPNLAVDNFVLSSPITNYIEGIMHFTDNSNLAAPPIKFAGPPYPLSNFPPSLIFSNNFENAFPGLYDIGSTLPGFANAPNIGVRNWTVVS